MIDRQMQTDADQAAQETELIKRVVCITIDPNFCSHLIFMLLRSVLKDEN